MGKEIERKFLVKDMSFKTLAVRKIELAQGYISTDVDSTVRVRIAGQKAFLTIKSRTVGFVRGEWEYEIPVTDARELLQTFTDGKFISKTRYVVPYDGLNWEVDVFHSSLEGLIVAEVELPSEATVLTSIPAFIGKEISEDPRYYNSALVRTMAIPE